MIFQKSDGPFTTNAISGLSCAKAAPDSTSVAALAARSATYLIVVGSLPLPGEGRASLARGEGPLEGPAHAPKVLGQKVVLVNGSICGRFPDAGSCLAAGSMPPVPRR